MKWDQTPLHGIFSRILGGPEEAPQAVCVREGSLEGVPGGRPAVKEGGCTHRSVCWS